MVVHETYRATSGEWLLPSDVRIDSNSDGRFATKIGGGERVEIGPIEKMSKSKRNTVDPDDIIGTFGADTARWFMLSDSPPDRDVIWSEDGVQGAARFVQTLWRLVNELSRVAAPVGTAAPASVGGAALAIRKAVHGHLLRAEDYIERLRFNTAIAEIRKLSNALSDAIDAVTGDVPTDLAFAFREAAEVLVRMFAPMMPHLAEECWALIGHATPVASTPWPFIDKTLAIADTVTLPVQVNGKKRAELTVEREADESSVQAAALALEPVLRALEGKPVKRVIVVPQRIINVVA
jgi:leucyl-tRNA synthetase